MQETRGVRRVIIRDMLIFQVKLALDAGKDIFLAPMAVGATVLDVLLPGKRPGHRFYGVMRLGERFDRWLSLFSAAERADAARDGLLGARRAGEGGMLGEATSPDARGSGRPPVPRETGARSGAPDERPRGR